MTYRVHQLRSPWRRVFLTLASLALALGVMIPQGFMAASAADASAFPIVLCTGHGPQLLQDQGSGKGAPAGKAPHDAPCVFAGHSGGAPAPSPHPTARVAFVAYSLPPHPGAPRDLAPGRGLPAPPLPARGPPALTI